MISRRSAIAAAALSLLASSGRVQVEPDRGAGDWAKTGDALDAVFADSEGDREASAAVARAIAARAENHPHAGGLALVEMTFAEPVRGLERVERAGLDARRPEFALESAGTLLDCGPPPTVARTGLAAFDAEDLLGSLDTAAAQIDAAFAGIDGQAALFDGAASHFRDFAPHHGSFTPESVPRHQAEQAAVEAWSDIELRRALLFASLDLEWLARSIAAGRSSVASMESSDDGRIIVGTPGDDHHHLAGDILLVIDPGGNDTYTGSIASPTSPEQRIAMVIDLAGNDVYRPSGMCGLATGRLGIGLLYDVSGDDTYYAGVGGGGAGYLGFGVLIDEAGDDTYLGEKFSLGAGFAGAGVLFDQSGDDRTIASWYCVGVGGPSGVGLQIDVEGDDMIAVGFTHVSGYNPPEVRPGDPKFQYTAFGVGMGVGKRLFVSDPAAAPYNLAGGIGLAIDHAGDDTTRTSNFSQGCGYYYGLGARIDVRGDDVHFGARYGHAAGAHFGAALFADHEGDDTYGSSGPTYNIAASWDFTTCVFLDAAGADHYDLQRSEGWAIANHTGWAVGIDLDGTGDRSEGGREPGRAANNSFATWHVRGAGGDAEAEE